jgi:lantibiotic modifying enzyme
MLAAACGLADRILARAQDDGRRVNWLCLEPLDDRIWAVRPQGAGLPHGYCGTALFLAELAGLTGTERYTSVARRALAPLPGLLTALADRPADLPAIGAGFAGLGGIAYALSRLGGLLDDTEVARWAGAAVDLAAAAAGTHPQPGVLDGDAGCLAAMLAVQRATGSTTAGRTARACADRLAALPPGSLPAGGFGSGAAGIGWALLRFAAAGGGPAYASAGLAALRTAADRSATAPAGTGWCDERSGAALAIADSGAAAQAPELAALLDLVVEGAVAPTGGDHSLCHGEAGALDLLLTAAGAGRAGPGTSLPRATALLAALDRFGPRCGTPDSVSSPGLLNGLAGIGNALLRLGFGARVPSVLLLRTPAS